MFSSDCVNGLLIQLEDEEFSFKYTPYAVNQSSLISAIKQGFLIQVFIRLSDEEFSSNYSRTSVARTLMARLPRLVRTRF